MSLFGCEFTGFADFIPLENFTEYFDAPDDSESYLMFFHCIDNEFYSRKVLRTLIVTVYALYKSETTEKPFHVIKFFGEVESPYTIIDLEVISV